MRSRDAPSPGVFLPAFFPLCPSSPLCPPCPRFASTPLPAPAQLRLSTPQPILFALLVSFSIQSCAANLSSTCSHTRANSPDRHRLELAQACSAIERSARGRKVQSVCTVCMQFLFDKDYRGVRLLHILHILQQRLRFDSAWRRAADRAAFPLRGQGRLVLVV